MKDTKNTPAIFGFKDDVTVLCCTTCNETIKKGPQFNTEEVYAAMGKRYIEGQNCNKCKYEGNKIYVCIPGTVREEDTGKPVVLSVYERNDASNHKEVGEQVGTMIVQYEVWDKMDSENLACAEPMFTNKYIADNFEDILWNNK